MLFYFFFQAEDGIRDWSVTGVQTCALPIYQIDPAAYLRRTFEEVGGYDEMIVLRDITFESHCEHHMAPMIGRVHIGRSEERRVGKECRGGWGADEEQQQEMRSQREVAVEST